ncbi:hypothetical protein MHYP_G00113420 [Metynnis hypsauchen]
MYEGLNHAHFSHISTCSDRAPNHHSQSTLQPPLPPPHNAQTLSHHQSSANSLNRNTLSSRRNPIHAPPAAPGDGPTTPESVQLQDSWVLNSNVPLETSILSLFLTPLLWFSCWGEGHLLWLWIREGLMCCMQYS